MAMRPDRDDAMEQQELAARHRPDERAPNAPAEPPGSGGGDRHAAGAPAGGSAVGGLAGTNVGDGDPANADIDEAGGGGDFDQALAGADERAHSGISGGAVGGTPAGKRTGDHSRGGIAPEGVHRGDSTVGSNPNRPKPK